MDKVHKVTGIDYCKVHQRNAVLLNLGLVLGSYIESCCLIDLLAACIYYILVCCFQLSHFWTGVEPTTDGTSMDLDCISSTSKKEPDPKHPNVSVGRMVLRITCFDMCVSVWLSYR
jgi:hypothetical protein